MARIIVAGVVRNCAHVFYKEIEIIAKAFSNHVIVKNIIVESDSSDGSLEVLYQWSRQSKKNSLITLGSLASTLHKRTERIAYCRNIYLKYCEENFFFDSDYLFVTDLDGVNSLLSVNSVDTVIAKLQENPGAAATANQLYKYYDIWALRHPVWSPNDCWASYHKIKGSIGENNAHELCNYSRMLHIPSSGEPIEVMSAFGGGALYRTSYLRGCRYNGLTKTGEEVCEHVSFSSDYIGNGGKIFVFPNLINHDVSEHVKNAEQFNRTLKSESIVHGS